MKTEVLVESIDVVQREDGAYVVRVRGNVLISRSVEVDLSQEEWFDYRRQGLTKRALMSVVLS